MSFFWLHRAVDSNKTNLFLLQKLLNLVHTLSVMREYQKLSSIVGQCFNEVTNAIHLRETA